MPTCPIWVVFRMEERISSLVFIFITIFRIPGIKKLYTQSRIEWCVGKE
jgi:hypothetical protein